MKFFNQIYNKMGPAGLSVVIAIGTIVGTISASMYVLLETVNSLTPAQIARLQAECYANPSICDGGFQMNYTQLAVLVVIILAALGALIFITRRYGPGPYPLE